MTPSRLHVLLATVAIAVAAWCTLAIPARATYGARVTADEPQYLLSAMSLAEDFDLDISDELAAERYRGFHEADLPRQTEPLADGREVSPHDPLLPLLLAVPVALGGWVGAKVALAAMAGALAAALVWVAVRRFGVAPPLATGVVTSFAVTAPLAAYGSQVYPEIAAALAVTIAIAALTGALSRRGITVLAIAVVALPWLSVKYAPVAAALAAAGAVRLWRDGRRREVVALGAGLSLAAVAFAVFHQVVYGGWTVYAAGDHFVGGELTAAGRDPDYAGRARRLAGLLLDREFGLAAWAPAFLLAVPALTAMARRRPPGWPALGAPLAAGWLTATFVAFTMHGWWWPGRQVVVVVPCLVLAVAWWASTWAGAAARRGRHALAVLGATGVVLWGWLLAEVLLRQRTLVVDFFETADPLYRAWAAVLPGYRHLTAGTWLLQTGWLLVLALACLAAWRAAVPHPPPDRTGGPSDVVHHPPASVAPGGPPRRALSVRE